MKATANGKKYEADTWKGIVAKVLVASDTRGQSYVIRQERDLAAKQLSQGITAVVGGVLIKPEGARE
jgi:hypothetical protein